MEIKEILMTRDKMTAAQAVFLIEEAKEELKLYLAEGDTLAASTICEDFFGLEEDYIVELM